MGREERAGKGKRLSRSSRPTSIEGVSEGSRLRPNWSKDVRVRLSDSGGESAQVVPKRMP